MTNSYEGQNMVIFDVLGEHLHAKMTRQKQVPKKLRGKLVEIMCEVNREHK